MKSMSRPKNALATALLLLLALGLLIRAAPRWAGPWLLGRAIGRASALGLQLKSRDNQFSLTSFESRKLEVSLVKAPWLLLGALEQFQLVVTKLRILKPSLGVGLTARIYGGQLTAQAELQAQPRQWQGLLCIRELQLAQHPQLHALGVLDGSTSLKLNDFVADQSGRFQTTGQINLSGLRFSPPAPSLLSQLNLPTLTAINNLNLLLNFRATAEALNITSLALESELGRATGQCQLSLAPLNQSVHLELEFSGAKPELKRLLAWALGLDQTWAAGSLDSFRVLVEGALPQPRIQVTGT